MAERIVRTSVSMPQDVFLKMEAERGMVSRSAYVAMAVELALSHPSMPQVLTSDRKLGLHRKPGPNSPRHSSNVKRDVKPIPKRDK